MEQIGGAMVATGEYSCLFKDPVPICKNNGLPINAEIGKVTVMSGYGVQDEKKKTAILKEIPELAEYVIVPTKSCVAAAIQPDEQWSKCNLTENRSELLVLGMQDGGRTLKKAMEKPAFLCRHFLSVLEHLLEGLLLLHSAGWNHTDIHDNNILIDTNGSPRFIDFGLAFNKQNPNKEEMENYTEFNPSLRFMPPEYHVYALFFQQRDIPTGLQEIINATQYNEMEALFNKAPVKTVLDKLASDTTITTGAVSFYLNHGDKLDVWSLGVSFYTVLRHCLMWPLHNRIPEFVKAFPRIKTILAMMLEYDPMMRGSVKQILELVNPQNRFLRVNRLAAASPLPPFSKSIRMRRGTLKNPQKRV
jgi:serine/threonine protein kinase